MTQNARYPFPGMNPYLEHPDLWPDVHNRLITMMANALTAQVRPYYYVAIEERVYWAGPKSNLVGRADVAVVEPTDETIWPRIGETLTLYNPFLVDLPTAAPDDEIREWYLEVREAAGGEVVTTIELLSPTNKQRGSAGYASYLKKRLDILLSQTHLVEIDLLRGGLPLPMTGDPPESDYRIVVSRTELRPQAHLYAFNVRDAMPACPIPLRQEDGLATLSLQTLLPALYEQAGYDLRINYHLEPVPPLAPADALWAAELTR